MNFRLNRTRTFLFGLMTVAGSACGEATEPEGEIESTLQREARDDGFAAYKAAHVRFSTTLGRFVVEDDLTFSTEDEVRDYFRTSRTDPSSLTSDVNASVVSKWDYAKKRDLTYCVSTAFGANQAAVRTAMLAATAAWENVADVRYVYRGDQDSNCFNSNQNVVFNVIPTTPGEFQETAGALSFRPHMRRSERQIFVNFEGVNADPPRTMIGILTHELGHTLGFRHEHIHGSTSGGCAELDDSTWLQQTPYDGLSVMHYPQCPGSANPGDFSLSQFDIHGVTKVYDAPTHVVIAGGALYARRMSDGYLFKRTGSTWTQVTNQVGVGFRMHSFVGTSAGMFMLRMGSNAVDFCPASSTAQLTGCVNIGGKVGQIFPCPGNTICVTTPDTGDLLRYNGTPNNWTKIGGPGKRFVSNGTRLYGISPGGHELWTFTPSDNFWRRRLGPSSELLNVYPSSGTEDFAYIQANASLYRFFPSPSSTTEPYNSGQFGGTGLAAQFESGGPNLLSIPLEHNQVRKFNVSTGSWAQFVTGSIARMHRTNGKLFLTDTAFNIYEVTEGTPTTITVLGQP